MYKTILASILAFQATGLVLLIFLRKVDFGLPLPDEIFYIAILLGAVFYLFSKKLKIFRDEKLLAPRYSGMIRMLTAALITALFLTLPLQTIANVDRSRSLYMFAWIKCSPQGTSYEDIQKAIEKKLGSEARKAFNMRVAEQQKRGFISISNNTVKLTSRGEVIFRSAKYLAEIYELEGWYKNDLWGNKECL
jgi:hypothetical protein